MTSIRDYAGEIYLCKECWQPCYRAKTEFQDQSFEMCMHFDEQWDYVHCPHFPGANEITDGVPLHGDVVDSIKEKYGTETESPMLAARQARQVRRKVPSPNEP